jgi:hypothetical protein
MVKTHLSSSPLVDTDAWIDTACSSPCISTVFHILINGCSSPLFVLSFLEMADDGYKS